MGNRIEDSLKERKAGKEKALVTFMMAGLPDMEGTKSIIRAAEEAGADIVELGIPFSDPIADGPVIQQASCESIRKGMNLEKVFGMTADLRENCKLPLIFVLYYNTVLHYGVREFAEKCVECGVDGLLILDLPLEEQVELQKILDNTEHAPILLQTVTLVSGKRIPMILKAARGFVYAAASDEKLLKEVKAAAQIPVLVECGLEEAAAAKADGVVISSDFVAFMRENAYNCERIKEYIRKAKEAIG